MGEVLKVLKETKLGGGKFLIELNEPLAKGAPRIIHLQNDKFRMEMIEPEFLKIAGAVAYARKRFDDMKGWRAQ
ncbi:MAG: hypothetical protein IKN16_07500 [Selenomonadaceae bacterium]|nr:hypothetical protein [Selenomonadaceae bacterium]